MQEETVARTWTPATGIVSVGSVGQPTPAGSVGVAGSTEPDHSRTESSDRARGGKVSGSAAVDDASWCRSTHRIGVCIDHRRCEPLSVWETGGELSRTGAIGRFQRKSTTAGTHHQAGEFDVAFSAGGSGPGHSAQSPGMAPQVCALDDAAWTQDCEGSDGTTTGGSVVLDDAPRMGLSAVEQVRFARRTARKSRWCSVEHRVIDWASCSSSY